MHQPYATGQSPSMLGMQPMPMMAQQASMPSAAPHGLGEEDWLQKAARLAAEKLQDRQPAARPMQSVQPFPQMPMGMPQQPPADLQAAGMQGLAALVAAQNSTL
jgi:hypothetical protein